MFIIQFQCRTPHSYVNRLGISVDTVSIRTYGNSKEMDYLFVVANNSAAMRERRQ